MDNILIPRDVLLHLSTFLDPFTGNSLRLTCKFLHSVLADTYEKPVHLKFTNTTHSLWGYIFIIEIPSEKLYIPVYFYVFDSPEKTIYRTDQLANVAEIHHTKSEKFATLIYKKIKDNVSFLITLPQMYKIIDIARQICENHGTSDANIRYYLKCSTLQDINFKRLFFIQFTHNLKFDLQISIFQT